MLKRMLRALLAGALLILYISAAFAEEAEQVTVTAEQAQEALKAILPDVKVISTEPSVIAGVWEVAFISRGDRGIVYIDETKQNIFIGSIIGLTTGINYTKKKFESINTVDFASISLEDSVILGNPDAEHKVVVFDDPD